MRPNVNVIVAVLALAAGQLWAQAPSPAPDANQAAANPPARSAPARAKSNAGDPADARVCLEFPTNLEIIRCAEKYRHRKAPA
jgi:hypothetical protein